MEITLLRNTWISGILCTVGHRVLRRQLSWKVDVIAAVMSAKNEVTIITYSESELIGRLYTPPNVFGIHVGET